MTRIFHTRDLLSNARAGLTAPAVDTCACCGEAMTEAQDRAVNWLDLDGVAEAEKHYRGPLCVTCFEDFATCACCGKRRRQQDLWTYEPPLCSARCEVSLEYDNTARDNRLGAVDYGL